MSRFDTKFRFERKESAIHITAALPSLEELCAAFGVDEGRVLVVCDENTRPFADALRGGGAALCALQAGEAAKSWASVEAILGAARKEGLGRDGLFIGLGGGVVTDLAAFAAAIYMRGARLALVSTTLLGMVDAAVGGKAGFDLFGIKNLAGAFYPAEHIYMPLNTLSSLPERELKSGLAELIKTAVLAGDEAMLENCAQLGCALSAHERGAFADEAALQAVSSAVSVKGRIVEADPREERGERALLNLGHTFGHALEAQAGLGVLTHGEAVAWGLAQSCVLGAALSVTPPLRARRIRRLLEGAGFEIRTPHPAMGWEGDTASLFMNALKSDKKRARGRLNFIVPDAERARLLPIENMEEEMIRDLVMGKGRAWDLYGRD